MPDALLGKYMESLVDCFFKVLPMRESNDETLQLYMESLLRELSGCLACIPQFQNDKSFLMLLFILQSLIDGNDTKIEDTRRDVFRAISICNKIRRQILGGA